MMSRTHPTRTPIQRALTTLLILTAILMASGGVSGYAVANSKYGSKTSCLLAPNVSSKHSQQLASGLTLVQGQLTHTRSPGKYYAMKARVVIVAADMSRYRMAPLTASRWSTAAPLSRMAQQRSVLAAVNGGFFHMGPSSGETGPDSAMVLNKIPYQLSHSHKRHVIAFDAQGIPQATDLWLDGSAQVGGVKVPLLGMNTDVPTDVGMLLWTAHNSKMLRVRWGATVSAGVITHLWKDEVPAAVKADEVVIGTTNPVQAADLGSVLVSDKASVSWNLRSTRPMTVVSAVGSGSTVVRNGVLSGQCTQWSEAYHPRTVIGWNSVQHKMWMAAAQSAGTDRNWYGGTTTRQLAGILMQLGADNVVAMDGGGSTELLARTADTKPYHRYDEPDNTYERPVPTGVGLFLKQST